MKKLAINRSKKFLAGFLAVAAIATSAAGLTTNASAADTADTVASVSFTPGQLDLIGAPNLEFGTNQISDKVEFYDLTMADTELVVSDLRGSGDGWKLTVALSQFTHESSQPTLAGANIKLHNLSIDPLNGNIGSAPNISDVTLSSDGASRVLVDAQAGKGLGSWGSTFTPGKATLEVLPGTAKIGTSTASMNWVLENTP